MKKTYVVYTNEDNWKTVAKGLRAEGAKLKYMLKLNVINNPGFALIPSSPVCILYSCNSKTNKKIISRFLLFGDEPQTVKEL